MGWDLDETARYIVSTLNRWRGEVLKHTFPTNPFSEQQQKDNGVQRSTWESTAPARTALFFLFPGYKTQSEIPRSFRERQ